MKKINLIAALLALVLGSSAFAQTTTHPTVNSVTAIKNGGTSSSLGNLYGLYGMPIPNGGAYHAFGDSITCGVGAVDASCSTAGYANLLTTDMGVTLTNYAVSGDQSCDATRNQIFPNENPGKTKNSLYSLMIGVNDATQKGVGSYEAVYKNCHQAALSWLSISSAFKTFAQTCSQIAGSWTTSTAYGTGVALFTTTTSSKLDCAITTYGGPIYLWYGLLDGSAGVFTYSVDGGAVLGTATRATTPPIATVNGGTTGVGVVRLTNIPAGAHTVHIIETAGNDIVIGGVGTPSTDPYWGAPVVYSSGVTREQNDVNSAATAAYNADALADVVLLNSDGLPIRFVDVRGVSGLNTTTDMFSPAHPNATGHGKLRDAFAGNIQYVLSTTSTGSTNPAIFPVNDNLTGASMYISGNGANATPLSGTATYLNTAVGYQALGGAGGGNTLTVAAVSNTAFGSKALTALTTGDHNVAFGGSSGANLTTGIRNTYIGNNSGLENQTGGSNTGVGYQSLLNSAFSVASNSNNSALGVQSGAKITTGSNNTVIGYQVASTTLTTGSNNLLLGTTSGIDASSSSASNEIHIGTTGDSIKITGSGTLSTEAVTIRGVVTLTDIATDATHTDASVCEDTTTHTLYSGSGTLGVCLGTSSARYKENIVQLSPALELLMKLKPVNFNLSAAHGDPKKKQFGFIAEDAVKVFPDLVGLDVNGIPNTFDYTGLIAPIVKGLQEQQQEISVLSPGLAPYRRCVWWLPVLCDE